jgi:hypothetical protein
MAKRKKKPASTEVEQSRFLIPAEYILHVVEERVIDLTEKAILLCIETLQKELVKLRDKKHETGEGSSLATSTTE